MDILGPLVDREREDCTQRIYFKVPVTTIITSYYCYYCYCCCAVCSVFATFGARKVTLNCQQFPHIINKKMDKNAKPEDCAFRIAPP
jgi:hypothetical protein